MTLHARARARQWVPRARSRWRKVRDRVAAVLRAKPWVLWLVVAIVYLALNALLVPTASNAYDEAGLLGGANDWLRYGLPLFYFSKTGGEVDLLGILAEAVSTAIRTTGLASGVAAVHIAYKLPLLAANLGCAVSLTRLARRFGSSRPELVGLLWLFNPVGFWVAAGHGQIEPLSVFAAVASLDLLLAGRPGVAGMLCAFGAGIEYFPMAVGLAAVLLVVHHRVQLRSFGRFVVGFTAILLASFAPVLAGGARFTSALRAFAGGVSAAHAAGAPPVSPYGLSIWFLAPKPALPTRAELVAVAVLLLALVVAHALLVVQRRAVDPERVALGVVASLMVLTVVLDPITNAQFALIVAGGLFLLAIAYRLPWWVAVLVPLAGLCTYLVYESPWLFFLDFWAQRPIHLPTLPTSSFAAIVLARGFTLGSIAGLGWAGHLAFGRSMTRSPTLDRKQYRVALGTSMAACIAMASFGAVPAFWSAVGPSGPAHPVGLSGFVVEPSSDATLTSSALEINYGRELAQWAQSGIVQPKNVVEVAPEPLYAPAPRNVATSTATASWPEIRLNLGQALASATAVQSYWVRLLVGSSTWTNPAALAATPLIFLANGQRLHPSSVAWSSPTWAVVNLHINRALIGPSGELTLRAPRTLDKWDSWGPSGDAGASASEVSAAFLGSTPRSWYPITAIYPARGQFSATVGGQLRRFRYRVSVSGEASPVATIAGVPTAGAVAIPLRAIPFAMSSVLNVGFQFPPNQPFRYHDALIAVGALTLLLIFALVAAVGRAFRRAMNAGARTT